MPELEDYPFIVLDCDEPDEMEICTVGQGFEGIQGPTGPIGHTGPAGSGTVSV